MRFWFQKSSKNSVFVGAEHGGVSGFAALPDNTRDIARAISTLGALYALGKMRSEERETMRRQKEAARRMKTMYLPRKNPRRGAGMKRRGFLRRNRRG